MVLGLLAACAGGDPSRGVDRLSDVDLSDGGSATGGLTGTAAADGTLDDLSEDGVRVAAVPQTPVPQTQRGGFLSGLFGRAAGAGAPKAGDPDFAQVAPGQALPYGELARLCNVPESALGTRVDVYPETGRGYALYDSQPGNAAAHTFYMTGFDDGCARQFTAAFALFSGPGDFERLRYGVASATMPSSRTDAAYETLKRQVCGVRRGQPCGRRIGRMERDTAFVSIYEKFGSNARWKTVLLHDGGVLAADLRTN